MFSDMEQERFKVSHSTFNLLSYRSTFNLDLWRNRRSLNWKGISDGLQCCHSLRIAFFLSLFDSLTNGFLLFFRLLLSELLSFLSALLLERDISPNTVLIKSSLLHLSALWLA